MSIKDNEFLVSKIKKIKVKNVSEPKYLVKWYRHPIDTWEPVTNFPDDIKSYPGYKESLNNLYRVRNKKEKDAIKLMINYFFIDFV